MTAEAHEPHIGLVVEGRGELFAVPVLLRKRLQEQGEYRDILGKPVPCHGRNKALAPNGVEGYVATAAARPGCVGVLVVLDAEDDAACELGPELLERAQAVTEKPVAICLAESKFEAWLLASAETLDLPTLAYVPGREPVAQLKSALPAKYVKPTWQPRLASRLDFGRACPRAPDLARLVEKLEGMLGAL